MNLSRVVCLHTCFNPTFSSKEKTQCSSETNDWWPNAPEKLREEIGYNPKCSTTAQIAKIVGFRHKHDAPLSQAACEINCTYTQQRRIFLTINLTVHS